MFRGPGRAPPRPRPAGISPMRSSNEVWTPTGMSGSDVRSCAAANPAVSSIPSVAADERMSSAVAPDSRKAPARNHRGREPYPESTIPAAKGTSALSIGMRSSRFRSGWRFMCGGVFGQR